MARTPDEAFFMACWISAWSDMPWIQLRANLQLVTMPPRLSDTDPNLQLYPLVIPFEVPLNLHDAAGKPMGKYKLKEAGDPQLYPGTFKRMQTCHQMRPLELTRKEWTNWKVLQDDEEGASVSVAELMPETPRELEQGELADDELNIASSVASQKHEEVVLDQMGMPSGRANPMVDFQLLDFERRQNPCPRDATFQGFSYCQLTFLSKEFLERHFQDGANQRAAKVNLTGMADATYDCLLEHRTKKVDVVVQVEQSVAGPSRQQTAQLVRATMALTMTDVKPDMALGLIMPRCAPGFFPGTMVFTNAGAAVGQLVRDRS